MADRVTMQQVTDWIERNKERTWNVSLKGKRSFEIKYLDFVLDTRMMLVFRIASRGCVDMEADYREDFKGSILDLLEYKLNASQKKGSK